MKEKHEIIKEFAEMIIEELKPEIMRMVSNRLLSTEKGSNDLSDFLASKIGSFDATGTSFQEVFDMVIENGIYTTKNNLSKNLSSMGYQSSLKRIGDSVQRILGEQRLQIIVGCEESQEVTKALRELGHEAYSCDLKECSGGHPEWHLKMDVFEAIELKKWDMGIFFPDCTYLTISANKWYKDQTPRKSGVLVGEERRQARERAVNFFMRLYNCNIPKVAIENPVGVMSTRFRKPDQVLQPWMFGHGETKATCLWLRGLPKLEPTNIVEGRHQRIHLLPKTKNRAELRSKTYSGIAKAMSEQFTK